MFLHCRKLFFRVNKHAFAEHSNAFQTRACSLFTVIALEFFPPE